MVGDDRGARRHGGRLILVVGPSGAGKDTLLAGTEAALQGRPGLRFARRAITRPADAGGEDHVAMTPEAFAEALARGAFLFHWSAHGLDYGVPAAVGDWLAAGIDVVLNGSRAAAPAIVARHPASAMVTVTAPEAVVAARLAGRGREDAEAIERRRRRAVPEPPAGIPHRMVLNDADVATGVARLTAAIEALRALSDEGWAPRIVMPTNCTLTPPGS